MSDVCISPVANSAVTIRMPSTPRTSWATTYDIRLRPAGSQVCWSASVALAYSFPAAFAVRAVMPSPTTNRVASVNQVERRLRSLTHSACTAWPKVVFVASALMR